MDPETSPLTDLQRSTNPLTPLGILIYSIFFHGPTEYLRKRFYDDDELWGKYETEGMSVSGKKLDPVVPNDGENEQSLYTIVQYQIDGIQQRRRLSVSRKEEGCVDQNGDEGGKKEQNLEAEGVLYYTKIRNPVEIDVRGDALRGSTIMSEGTDLNQPDSQHTTIATSNKSKINQISDTNKNIDNEVDLIVLPLYPNSAILRSVVTSRPEKQSARFVDQFFGFAYYYGYSCLFGFI